MTTVDTATIAPVAAATADRRSLTTSAVWLMAAKTIAFALTFALPLLLVRQLSQTEFGLYKQVFLLVNTAISMLPFGFAMSAFYFLPRQPHARQAIAFNIVLFHLVVGGAAALAILARPSILQELFNGPDLVDHAPVIALLVVVSVVSCFLEIISLANGDVGAATGLIVVTYLSKAVLLVGAALFFPSVPALITAAMIQAALQLVVLLGYLQVRFRGFWRSLDPAVMRAQLAYAIPLGLAAIISQAQADLHNYFIAHYFSAAAYAIYAIGCFQLPIFWIVSEAVGGVMIPAISALQRDANPREIVRLTARLIRVLTLLYAPLFAVLAVIGPDIIIVLFTARYADSWPVFAVNLALIPLSILTSACDPVLRAHPECTRRLVRLRVGLLAVMILGLWFTAARLSMVGAAGVMVAITFVDRACIAVLVGRVLRVTASDLRLFVDVAKIGAATAAAIAAGAVLRTVAPAATPLGNVLVGTVVVSAGFALAVPALRIVTPQERAEVVRRLAGLWRRV